MQMFGQTQLLLGSLVVGCLAISALSLFLIYRLCVRANKTSETLGGNISSIVTELISAKTYAETGNDRLATNMLSHSTNWQNTQKTVPIQHPIDTPEEELAKTFEPQVGPGLSDIEILGDDLPPEALG